ncbi:MAG: MFS transporter [Acidimicrobiales bacterium]
MALSSRASARPNIALGVIVATQLMVVLDVTVVNIALASIQRSLHFSTAGLSWVINAYTLTFGGLLLLGGRAGDVFGRRRVLSIGLAVFTASSLLGGLAQSSSWLLAARAFQGIGAAMAAPSTLALITATFEQGPARNRALGVFSAVAAGGGSLGLILGGALTAWVSWRWVLFINVPIGLAIIAMAPRYIVEPPRHPGRLDLRGGLLSTAGLATLIYGFIRVADHGRAFTVTGLFVLAVALLGAFVVLESRTREPLMPLGLLRDRARAAGFVDMMLSGAAMYGMFFFTSQFLQRSLGYSPLVAGLAFLPLTALIFAGSRVTPKLVNRLGPTRPLVVGLVLITAGLAWLAQAPANAGYVAGLLGPLVLFGAGAGSAFMPLTVTILSGVERDNAGAVSGMLQTMQQVGGSLGLAVLVTIASAGGQSAALTTGAGLTALAGLIAVSVLRAPAVRAVPVAAVEEVGVGA